MILSEEEILSKLPTLPGWSFKENQIQKTFLLENFSKTMELVNEVSLLAEELQHHPDINIRFNKVTFTLSTHSEKGVTEKDFVVAEGIEQAAQAQ